VTVTRHPEGHPGSNSPTKYPVLLVADRTTSSSASTSTDAGQGVHGGVGAHAASTPPRPGLYHIQNKEIDPDLAMCPTAPGPATSPAPPWPAGVPRQPRSKARWLGNLRRRGHPREPTRPTRSGTAASARLHPDGDSGRDRALRPGSGRRADLHRLRGDADLRDWHLFPSVLRQEVLPLCVSNAERADEDATLALSQDLCTTSSRRPRAPGSGATALSGLPSSSTMPASAS